MAIFISYVAKFILAFFIGRKILLPKFGERRGWAMILGLVVVLVIGMIPFVGNFIKTLLSVFALGGLVLAYKQPEIYKQKPLPRRGRPKKIK